MLQHSYGRKIVMSQKVVASGTLGHRLHALGVFCARIYVTVLFWQTTGMFRIAFASNQISEQLNFPKLATNSNAHNGQAAVRSARVQFLSKRNAALTTEEETEVREGNPTEDPCKSDEELARLLQEEENSMALWTSHQDQRANVFQAVCAGAGRLLSTIIPSRSPDTASRATASSGAARSHPEPLAHSTERPEQHPMDDSDFARRIQEEEWVAGANEPSGLFAPEESPPAATAAGRRRQSPAGAGTARADARAETGRRPAARPRTASGRRGAAARARREGLAAEVRPALPPPVFAAAARL